jgi:hypothetical protein
MIAFAFLGNMLFLMIHVSMLTNTFSKIIEYATAEIQFQRAVLTFEGPKSDAIFAYRLPFNILAIIVLLPLKFLLSSRWFHKVNVAAIRTLNAPILLFIGIYERRHEARMWLPRQQIALGDRRHLGHLKPPGASDVFADEVITIII